MKAYVTYLLYDNARRLLSTADEARQAGIIETEVAASIGAHLILALVLEGAINEVGETYLQTWVWEKPEKADIPLKWWTVVRLVSGDTLDPGKEPLQTVHRINQLRNRIAHPKAMETAEDLIVRHKDGRLEHDAARDRPVDETITRIWIGYGKILTEFNAVATREARNRVVNALRYLRDRANVPGLKWLESDGETAPV